MKQETNLTTTPPTTRTITLPTPQTPKPEGACEYIKPLPCVNDWYCSLFSYGKRVCVTCSRRV